MWKHGAATREGFVLNIRNSNFGDEVLSGQGQAGQHRASGSKWAPRNAQTGLESSCAPYVEKKRILQVRIASSRRATTEKAN